MSSSRKTYHQHIPARTVRFAAVRRDGLPSTGRSDASAIRLRRPGCLRPPDGLRLPQSAPKASKAIVLAAAALVGACSSGSGASSSSTESGGSDSNGVGGQNSIDGGAAFGGASSVAAGGSSGFGAAASATGGTSLACSVPLQDRVTIGNVALSASVDSGGRQLWGATGLPTMLAAAPNGTAKAAWSDGSTVHVTPLDAADARAADDFVVEGSEVRGLIAHDDGAAVLVVRGDEMVFVRFDSVGNVASSLSIVGGNSHTVDGDRWIDDWPHNGRLAWSGSQYAAYFGQTGNHGAAGDHQGDHYTLISPDGAAMQGGWDWGCSHSLDVRIAHNGGVFAPICTSDTYPGAGIWFDNRVEVSTEPSITNTGDGTKLGGLVPTEGGFWLNFSSPEGSSSYDVVLLRIDDDGTPSGRVQLTATSEDEQFAHLGAYGDGLLAGWGQGTSLTIAALDTAGQIKEGPVAISAELGGLDDFVSYPNGDVGWAFAVDGASTLSITRVARCQ